MYICDCNYLRARMCVAAWGLQGLSFITLKREQKGDGAETGRQKLLCKGLVVNLCVPVRTLLYVCGCGCFHLCVCVRALSCASPQRLSSLSSEATGVQSVCFHTPLLRYNRSHFFLPPLLLSPLCFLIFLLLFLFPPFLHLFLKPLSASLFFFLIPTPLHLLISFLSTPAVPECLSPSVIVKKKQIFACHLLIPA